VQKYSAGLLLYRFRENQLEVFLVHPGGPFWAKKDLGAWSIPKGEYVSGEDALQAAKREFQEETGLIPAGNLIALGEIRQSGGKIVSAWAMEGDYDPTRLQSNKCLIEWPPRSGRQMEVPEVDRGDWFDLEEARKRILAAQRPFLDRLASHVDPSAAVQ
jgi:predicted NUDIX family NTP pyrophosphohydrolase